MKKVSQLDINGYFVGTAIADESPLEPGVFLIPAGCVDAPPPSAITQGHRYKFSSKGWIDEPPPKPAPEPERTPEQIMASLSFAVQHHLDIKARERNYDGILSLCTYATSVNPKFAAEGQAGVEWRDAVWAKCYEILADVQAGTRPAPTAEQLIAELPGFTWPA